MTRHLTCGLFRLGASTPLLSSFRLRPDGAHDLSGFPRQIEVVMICDSQLTTDSLHQLLHSLALVHVQRPHNTIDRHLHP